MAFIDVSTKANQEFSRSTMRMAQIGQHLIPSNSPFSCIGHVQQLSGGIISLLTAAHRLKDGGTALGHTAEQVAAMLGISEVEAAGAMAEANASTPAEMIGQALMVCDMLSTLIKSHGEGMTGSLPLLTSSN